MRRDIPMNKVQKKEGYNYLQLDLERQTKRENVVNSKYRGYSNTYTDNRGSRNNLVDS